MSTHVAEQTPVLPKALAYTVDESGRVDTRGEFKTITAQQWDSFREVTGRGSHRYTRLMNDLVKGAICGVPVKDPRAAWNCRRTLHNHAERRGFSVETKTVFDPEQGTGLLVLVRRVDAHDE